MCAIENYFCENSQQGIGLHIASSDCNPNFPGLASTELPMIL